MTNDRRGGGAGGREQGEQSLSRSREAERNMGIKPRPSRAFSIGRSTSSFQSSPLLPAPRSPASFDENCQIVKAQWLGENWLVECSDGSQHDCDYIWLSTGTKFDVTTEPLLKDILEAYPTPIINGLPVLDTCLRWPGCELFIMGGLAALQVGPTARNLSGARMACEKIVPAIAKPSVAFSPSVMGVQAS